MRISTAFRSLLLIACTVAVAAVSPGARGQSAAAPSLAERIQKIIERPEFRHSFWGIEFYSLDTGKPVYTLNSDKLFTPASTTKLVTEGTALDLLGPDYRFHTPIYATGKIGADGTLKGDLILVASGDTNLSGRIEANDTLSFENHDHAYGGSPDTRAVPGDPLLVIHELAAKVAAHGIKRIEGRVLVDISLFPEGTHEAGTDVVLSPVVVNDNVIDVTVTPGAAEGAPAEVHISPETAYARFINKATTGAAKSNGEINFEPDTQNPDGSRTVTIAGSRPLGGPPILFPYSVPQPGRFAEMTLEEALRKAGVAIDSPATHEKPDFKALSASYMPENLVAEHVSPPLTEETKVTLKVSQNLHASSMPYILGAVAGRDSKDPLQTGFNLEHDFLEKNHFDLSAASQGDGAGGVAVYFTPDFIVHYLEFRSKQPTFPAYYRALPILGKDGTLWDIQQDSPAAGQVHAKTGTYGEYDPLNKNLMLTAKGLAGYLTTKDGRRLAFAIYVNRVPITPPSEEMVTKIAGQALGEIAAAAYDSPPPSN